MGMIWNLGLFHCVLFLGNHLSRDLLCVVRYIEKQLCPIAFSYRRNKFPDRMETSGRIEINLGETFPLTEISTGIQLRIVR